MANDPITMGTVTQFNVCPGKIKCEFLATGPADYDATNGSALDLSTYFETITSVTFAGVTAADDALVYATYVSADYDDASAGAVYFTWDTANDGNAQNARAFSNVADTTNLGGYQWRVVVEGTQVIR